MLTCGPGPGGSIALNRPAGTEEQPLTAIRIARSNARRIVPSRKSDDVPSLRGMMVPRIRWSDPARSHVAEVSTMPDVPDETASFPLIRALLERRSRRFAAGLRLNGGPLAFESRRPPAPLSVAEEATLAFAATGVTGHAL